MSDALQSLLEGSLDDLADLPENTPFPNGAHRVTCKLSLKEVANHPTVEATFKLLETLEAANPNEPVLAAGAECNVLYMQDNQMGQGKWKEFLKPIAAHLGTGSVAACFEFVNSGTELVIVTKKRTNKEKTAEYMDIEKVQVV